MVGVRGIPGPSDGLPTPGVDSPSNVWAPYGPYVNKLQLSFYYNGLGDGSLDLSEPCCFSYPGFLGYAAYDANPDIVQSVAQSGFVMYEFDFNHYAGPGTMCGLTSGIATLIMVTVHVE